MSWHSRSRQSAHGHNAQEAGVFERLTVLEHFELFARLKHLSSATLAKRRGSDRGTRTDCETKQGLARFLGVSAAHLESVWRSSAGPAAV